MSDQPKTPDHIKTALQFIVGVGLLAFAVYGYSQLHIPGFLCFVIGACGVTALGAATGIDFNV
jgi:hypothetical protein